ncbi:MFS transporter [Legionella spiritensis]|nr:MFS transporter [Legionella spiritensis]
MYNKRMVSLTLMTSSSSIRLPLAGINFFLADVRDGLGPFLAIYLIASQGWDSGKIGVIMTIAGVTTLLLQTPAGVIIDNTRFKRGIFIICSLAIAVAVLAIQYYPGFYVVAISKGMIGAAAAFFPPAIAALTLGTVGPEYYAGQVGRNEAFNHAGNIFAALMAALLGYYLGLESLFWFTAIMAMAAVASALSLNKNLIDHRQARGLLTDSNEETPRALTVLLENKTLLLFGIAILLFHLANAAMLILIGEEIAVGKQSQSPVLFVSGSIISAQFIMFFMAILVSKKVDKWGRKPLFLLGFIALPIRGLLFTLSSDPYYLLAVQLLDGIGAGLFGALFPIVIADLTRGTGYYNTALGALGTLQAIGAAGSTLVSGIIADLYGFVAAFYVLAGIALAALFLFYFAIPETRPKNLLPFTDSHGYETR